MNVVTAETKSSLARRTFAFRRSRAESMPLPVALLEHVAVVITSPCLPRYSRSFSSTCQQLAKAPKDEKAQYYSKSLRLPRTAFPLRADAGKREQLFWRRTTDELYAWQVRTIDGVCRDPVAVADMCALFLRLSRQTDHCLCCTTGRRTRMAICTAVSLGRWAASNRTARAHREFTQAMR